jgi:hypothetical protein
VKQNKNTTTLIFCLCLSYFHLGCTKDSQSPSETSVSQESSDLKIMPQTTQPIVIDRQLYANILTKTFISSSGGEPSDNEVRRAIQNEILDKPNFLGGPCMQNDDPKCRAGALDSDANAKLSPPITAPSEGLRMRVCKRISAEDNAIRVAATKIGVELTQDASAQNIGKMFKHFYLGKEPTSAEVEALINFHRQTQSKLDIFDAWRFTLYLFCINTSSMVIL